MRKFWKIAGIATLVAVLGIVAVGAAVYAQADTSSTGPFDFATNFKEALAGILGISVDKYDEAVTQAQTQTLDKAVSEGWLTQDQADLYQWRLDNQPEAGMWGFGKGFGRHGGDMLGGGMFGGDNLTSIAADKLGMKLTDLLTELKNGKTIAGVAKEKGIDTQTIVDAALAEMKTNLDQAVADGRITQKQADYQLQQAQTRITDQLDNTWQDMGPGGGHRGGMGGPGMGGL